MCNLLDLHINVQYNIIKKENPYGSYRPTL